MFNRARHIKYRVKNFACVKIHCIILNLLQNIIENAFKQRHFPTLALYLLTEVIRENKILFSVLVLKIYNLPEL